MLRTNGYEKKMNTIDHFKLEYFTAYIKTFEDYEVISNIFKNLSNYVLNPRFDEIITEPVDFNHIFQDSFNDGRKSLPDFFEYLKKILQNIFQYYEPESLAYRAALNLQRYSLEKFTRLNQQEVRFDKVLPSVQEILFSIFVETYNCKNADGKYLSDSILKLPANGWVNGVLTRVETLETIKMRLEEGLYSSLEELQTSLFNVFSRSRQSWQLNKDLYKDSVELQGAYINIRNRLCQHGTMQNSPACSFGLNELLVAVQDEKKNQNIDINAENQISSPDVEHHTSITNETGEKFNIGDFIYVNPMEFDTVSDCQIMEIHKIITDKDGQIIVYGWQFVKPQDINIYHGHITSVSPGIDEFCMLTVKFHNQELLKSDKFLYMPMSQVVKKCFIVTPLDYSEFHLNNVFNPDIYSCRYSYRFSNQKFEKLVMDDSQLLFSTELEKETRYLFDLKVTKRIRQWSILQEPTENIIDVPQFMQDQSVDCLHDYAHQSHVQPNVIQPDVSSVERISNLPSLKLLEENSDRCQERAALTATTSQPSSCNSGIKMENVEMGAPEIECNEEEFASEDINDVVSFNQCNTVVGVLKCGDFVYIQSKPEAERAIVHILEIFLSKTCDFMISGTKFIIQDKSPDSEFQNLITFNEAYWIQQRSIRPVSHVVGRCMVLNFQDYLYLRPSSIPEGDVYLCEFIYDFKKHRLSHLKFGMPEILHLEVIRVKMQRVAENFIIDKIHRRHMKYGKPIPIVTNEFDQNTLMDTSNGQSTNPVNNLRLSPKISVKKELVDDAAFVSTQSFDKFEIWQKDMMSWLKEQKRLGNKVFYMDFNRQANRYGKIFKMPTTSLLSSIKHFKQKYGDIISRQELIKSNRGRPSSKKRHSAIQEHEVNDEQKNNRDCISSEKIQSAIQENKANDEQKKPSCQQNKAADRFEAWKKDLMTWLKKQKQMNNIVSCNEFTRRACLYCTIYQLGDKLEHVKYFKQEFGDIISSEQLINDCRTKRSNMKRKSKVETNQFFGNEMTEEIKIWHQNLLSWLRDEKKLGHTTIHKEFYLKSFILYQELKLETSLVEQIIQFKKKYRDIIVNEKLLKESKNFTEDKKFGRKNGRSTRVETLKNNRNATSMSMQKSGRKKDLYVTGVSSKLSTADDLINFCPRKARNVVVDTSDASESEICTSKNSEVQNEIIKIWERELLHWLRTKKRLCEAVTLEDFHEKAAHFQNILKVSSPLESKIKNFRERYLDLIMKESLILFSVEKEKREAEIKSKICSNGCGFFGSDKTGGLCSKCYEGSLDDVSKSSCSSTSTVRSSSPIDSSLSPDSSPPSPPDSSPPSPPDSCSNPTSVSSQRALNKSVLHKCYFVYKRKRFEVLKARLPDFSKSQLNKIISDEWKAFPKDVKLSYKKKTKEELIRSQSASGKIVLHKCFFMYRRKRYEILKTRLPDFTKMQLSKIISDEWKAFSNDVKLSYMKKAKEKVQSQKSSRISAIRKGYFIYEKQRYDLLKSRLPDFEKFQLDKIISDEWKAFSLDVKLSYSEKAIQNEGNNSSTAHSSTNILKQNKDSPNNKIIEKSSAADEGEVEEVNDITEFKPTKVFKRKRGRPKKITVENPLVDEEKFKTKTLHGRTFLEDMEEIERRRRLCMDSINSSNQEISLTNELDKNESSSANFMNKYLEQLLEFFELPPDDLESYATFKWLQPTMDALRLSSDCLEDREKERDMNETWLNYGPRIAEQALIRRLKQNPLALGEFKQLAMSTPLLQIPKMSLAYESIF